MSVDRTNLLGLDRNGLKDYFISIGEKPFRSQQVLKWIYQEGVSNFDEMTNLSKSLREKLTRVAEIKPPEFVYDQHSADGTHKWIVQVGNGNKVETVFIPETNRGTLCISSQVGCALDCTFCSTAQQGFNRNLSAAEIIGQVWRANEIVRAEGNAITNVVFMGMGEPLLNFHAVIDSTNLMLDDLAYGLSKRRVTISTSGVVPAIHKLREFTDVALAISLHAPNNELREKLVPLNKKYPIEELVPACKAYLDETTLRKITWEYVMIDGVNDQLTHAKQLAKLLEGVPSKVNLIPFNPFPNTDYRRSKAESVKKFQDYLMSTGLTTTVRKTRGDDIDAACGQLVGKVEDKTKRQLRRAQ